MPLTQGQVEDRLARGENNAFEAQSSRTLKDIFFANVFTRVNLIYAVLFVLVMSTGFYFDGLFGSLIIANSGIGIVQEIRAKRTLDRLALVSRAVVTVDREAGRQHVAPEMVVLDDIVVIAAGDQIPVDGVVIDATGLEVDESLLTGESDPILAVPGSEVMSGSFVVAGSGRFRTTAVGESAYAQRIAREAGAFRKPSSQLRSGIDVILKYVTWVLIPIGILTVWNQLAGGQAWPDAIRGLVAALVPLVPEGLVLMTSIAMAVGVVRLGKRHCLVQDLAAIEQLARVDVVCTDKTGTLTEDGMRVTSLQALDATELSPAQRIEIDGVLAAIGHGEGRPNGSMSAILEYVSEAQPLQTIAHIPFSSARKWAAIELAAPLSDSAITWVLGAPDVLLDSSVDALAHIDTLSAAGLRTLALVSSTDPLPSAGLPAGVVPRALIVLDQRLRAEVPGAINYFAEQEVEIKVISGDSAAAVGTIARQAGVPNSESAVDMRSSAVDDPRFAETVVGNASFGRVTPLQKKAMVHALQSNGHIVAMTGDGVNDVLALKDADVGVAMGSGSPAARAVSRIVLLDNSFATLPHVVAEGRRVIGNIERVATLFLTKTLYSAILAFLVVVTAVPFPFLPRHITLIAWFTIGIPAFVLALAPNTARAQDGFVARVLGESVPGGIGAAFASFGAYMTAGAVFGVNAATRVTNSSTAFLALITVAFFVLVMVARPFQWWKALLVAVMVGAMLLVILTPLGSTVFDVDVSDWRAVAIALGFGLAGILLRGIVWTIMQVIFRKRKDHSVDRIRD